MRAWVIGAVVALSGCIDAELTLCGDGTACPANLVCDGAHHSCVAPDQLTACESVSDGGACHTSELAGECFDGVCLAPGCGNRVVEPGEQCDDGNRTGGDGCSADCRSDERCGNGVADVTLGEACDDGNLVSHDGCNSRCQSEDPAWRIYASSLYAISPVAAFDATHGDLLTLGGRLVWHWDGTTWHIPTALPPLVDAWSAAVYDTDRGHVVALARRGAANVVLDWDGTQWTELAQAGTDPGAVRLATYDPVQHSVSWITDVGFGQLSIAGASAAWSSATLLPFQLGTAPHAGFDGSRGVTVVVDVPDHGTWELAGATWTHIDAPLYGTSGHALVYDPDRGHLLAIGGYSDDPGGVSPEVLAWNGTTWDDTLARIPARANPVVWYDGAHHSVWLAGGITGSTSLTDVVELAGTAVVPHPFLQPTSYRALAYDASLDRILLLDGAAGTLAWNGAWRLATRDGLDTQTQLVYDPVRGGMLAFRSQQILQLGADWEVVLDSNVQSGPFTYDYGRRAVVAVLSNGTLALPSTGTTFTPIAPGPPSGATFAAYDLGAARVTARGLDTLSDLVGGQWQPSLSPAGTYQIVSALQTGSLVLVPLQGVVQGTQLWERRAGVFRLLDTMPFDGYIASAVERSRGRLVFEVSEGQGVVLLERQLVSALPDETCEPGVDADGDGAAGCADPDCWATCWPACPLATSCP